MTKTTRLLVITTLAIGVNTLLMAKNQIPFGLPDWSQETPKAVNMGSFSAQQQNLIQKEQIKDEKQVQKGTIYLDKVERKKTTPNAMQSKSATSESSDLTGSLENIFGSKTKAQTPSSTQTESTETQVPTCDCNNENDTANTPANFIYNADKVKIYRINPLCKCKVQVVETSDIVDLSNQTKTNRSSNNTLEKTINY